MDATNRSDVDMSKSNKHTEDKQVSVETFVKMCLCSDLPYLKACMVSKASVSTITPIL